MTEIKDGRYFVDGKEAGHFDGDYIVINDESIIKETLADLEESVDALH